MQPQMVSRWDPMFVHTTLGGEEFCSSIPHIRGGVIVLVMTNVMLACIDDQSLHGTTTFEGQHVDREPTTQTRHQTKMSILGNAEVRIRAATFPADKQIVSELFLAYAQSLPIKLDFQGFEQELADLPGKYSTGKDGAIFLAYATNAISNKQLLSQPLETTTGVVALHTFQTANSTSTCELKRLYITPPSRGFGGSKILMDAAISRARILGYMEMLLDTLRSMTVARKLYRKYGFIEIENYYPSVEDAVFYKLVL